MRQILSAAAAFFSDSDSLVTHIYGSFLEIRAKISVFRLKVCVDEYFKRFYVSRG